MNKPITLNIQPQAYQIFEVFERYSYNEVYALAEFIDNSTASYLAHKKDLIKIPTYKLCIDINYDNQTDTLTIEDNAYGMELGEFRNSILIGENKGKYPHTRNQFGSGMKTAATWFGNNWTIESSQLGSTNKYKTTIDVQDIKNRKTNDIEIFQEKEDKDRHYTRITIKQLHRNLEGKDIIKEINFSLGSMYRRDLASGNIEININGNQLDYIETTPFKDNNGVEWKKEIVIDFDFTDNKKTKHYTAKGYVGIAKKGSGFLRTGFALFQNDRGILLNTKPDIIFDFERSQISLKLYGEIDMDEFEVNQAKDGFSWTKELQEYFWKTLKSQITEYINLADKAWKDILNQRSSTPVPQPGTSQPPNPNPNPNPQPEPVPQPTPQPEVSPTPAQSKTHTIINNRFKIYLDSAEYEILLDSDMANNFLYDDKKMPLLKINKNHPFIANLNDDCILEICKMILCYVLSIDNAERMKDKKGFVMTSVVRIQFNSLLGKVHL